MDETIRRVFLPVKVLMEYKKKSKHNCKLNIGTFFASLRSKNVKCTVKLIFLWTILTGVRNYQHIKYIHSFYNNQNHMIAMYILSNFTTVYIL